ncbi:UNKNOWN [Stylonychia lemnae]|uniref:Uncharacterized protein n=1 Tax=Stylonychia lemnae TaxID=5949 RepID=A0A078BDB7_STYLE|nr:UNKNOWN [Stylonychia lemnae]|eukprot:CDW91588.1 UNKNOWN [Stylonychia lemnae]
MHQKVTQQVKTQAKAVSCSKKIRNTVVSYDMFGMPVTLTYKNKTNQYVKVDLIQNTQTWKQNISGNDPPFYLQKDQISYKLGKCDYGRFGTDPNIFDYQGIISGYLCPIDRNYEVKGNFANDDNPEQYSIEEFMQDQYFSLQSNKKQKFYFAISQNEGIKKDMFLKERSVQETFLETRFVNSYQEDYAITDSASNSYIEIVFQMDNQVKTITRYKQNVKEILEQIGGFMCIILTVAKSLSLLFTERSYYNTLIKSLYRYQTLEDKDQIYEDDIGASTPTNGKILKQNEKQKCKDLEDNRNDLQKLIDHLIDRSKLKFNMWMNCRVQGRKAGLCKTKKTDSLSRDKLYENGIIKINKELDIRDVQKELRNLKFITRAFLNKQQQFLLSYLKYNLLNEGGQIEQQLYDKFLLKNCLKQVLHNQKSSSIDKMILSQIQLDEVDQQLGSFKIMIHKNPTPLLDALQESFEQQRVKDKTSKPSPKALDLLFGPKKSQNIYLQQLNFRQKDKTITANTKNPTSLEDEHQQQNVGNNEQQLTGKNQSSPIKFEIDSKNQKSMKDSKNLRFKLESQSKLNKNSQAKKKQNNQSSPFTQYL